MGFEVKQGKNGWIELHFENVISLWNILKNISRTPYLKHFIVENYDGGNTQIDREYWNQEEIMFRELKKGQFLFPYESIGFVLDDSISDIDISVIDGLKDNDPGSSPAEYKISIRDTDNCVIYLKDREHVPIIAALYLFSFFDSGFDHTMLFVLKEGMRGILKDRDFRFEIVDGTFQVTMEALHFVLKIQDPQDRENYLHIQLGKRFSKKSINESQIKNLAYLKKKWLAANPLYQKLHPYFEQHPLVWIAVKIILWIFAIMVFYVIAHKLFHLSIKKIVPLLAFFFIVLMVYRWIRRFFRKNIYKRYLKYQDQGE